jgi:hypothetical protein
LLICGCFRKRCEAVLGLENELIKFRGEIERLQHERDQDRIKIKVSEWVDLLIEVSRLVNKVPFGNVRKI